MRINGLRSLTGVLKGKSLSEEQRRGLAALSALNKMFWSEYHQEVMALAIDVLGPAGQVLSGSGQEETVPGYGRRVTPADYPASALQSSFFFSRSETVWGGTAQIQRNIVGERVLGLPRDA
jgi:alkylation response protein AidB-like acyl-CoA dehydrogenase